MTNKFGEPVRYGFYLDHDGTLIRGIRAPAQTPKEFEEVAASYRQAENKRLLRP